MVHVPILKIDIPEPRLADLIPASVDLVINALTTVYDMVDEFVNPLSPEQEEVSSTLAVSLLPKEFRKARKRVLERNENDEDKISEDLEDAAFAYYRRAIRESMVGYSDELPEEVAFRRLIDPGSASLEVQQYHEEAEEDRVASASLSPAMEALLNQEAAPDTAGHQGPLLDEAAAELAEEPQEIWLECRARRVFTTSAAGAAGLATGVGALKLLQLVRRLRSGKQHKKGGRGTRQAAGAGAKQRTGVKPAQQKGSKPKSKDSNRKRIQR